MADKELRKNINFRQSPRSFMADRQAHLSYINRNIVYRVYSFSKKRFEATSRKLNMVFDKFKKGPPKPKV